MEAFQAGCDDYIDRSRPPAVIATHVRNIIISKSEGFQPTQMLAQADTSLSGSLSHHDLPGVMQMLGHAHQTGALHINSGDTDALLFFDAGEITHAECGALFGDEAVIHILQSCMRNNSGVYKFVYGSSSAKHTVLRSATDLMLDAMREMDESAHQSQQNALSNAEASGEKSPFKSLLGLADPSELQESAAITAAIDDFAASAQTNSAELRSAEAIESAPAESKLESRRAFLPADLSESGYTFVTPAPNETPAEPAAELLAESGDVGCAKTNSSSPSEPSFANYSIVPYAGNDIEDIT